MTSQALKSTKTLAYIHTVSQLLVLVGFLIGVFPTLFAVSIYWVAPLVFVNVVISIVAKDNTLPYTLTQIILMVASLMPFIGTLTALAGGTISVLALVELADVIFENQSEKKPIKKVKIAKTDQPKEAKPAKTEIKPSIKKATKPGPNSKSKSKLAESSKKASSAKKNTVKTSPKKAKKSPKTSS